MSAARRPARGRGPGFFRVIRFDRTLRGSQNALRYVAWRSEDVKGRTPHIFDDRSDAADVGRFMEDLEDPLTRHQKSAKAYHCLFSLKRPDFDRAGMSDWRDEVREVMRTYELQTRRKLHWIASFHDNPGRPHCHVIIKATYTNIDGHEKKLFLNRNEVERIKEITGKALEVRGLTPHRSAPVRDMARGMSPWVAAAGSTLSWLQERIREEGRRRAREEEEMHRRWLHEEERDGRGR
jgi:hypothetical protein